MPPMKVVGEGVGIVRGTSKYQQQQTVVAIGAIL